MISVKSNINEFLKNYRKKASNFKNSLNGIAEKLAKRMSEDMKSLIQTDKRWQEHGNLSTINEVSFDIESIGDNAVRVSIGDNLPKLVMTDGTLVNPSFFIEFGFGIVGERTPKKNHDKYNWEYNINQHKTAWMFRYNGELMESEGREGINFMYNTIQDYRTNWLKYLKELMESANG